MKLKIEALLKRARTPRGLKSLLIWAAFLALLTVFLIPAVKQIWLRLGSELNPAYVWDDPLYWAVGRGILNGLTPYRDLFETKPPGIFWMSALSLKLTGGVYAMNISSFFSLLVTGLVPSIATVILRKKINCGRRTFVLMLSASLLFGMMLALYSQNRSGYIQVEAFGAMFVCLYLLLIFDTDEKKLKLWSPTVIISGLLLACAGLMKEPFVFVAAGASLLFVRGMRGFFYKTILPLICGGAAGTAAMAATGTLKPYLTIYVKFIMDSRVHTDNSPYGRIRDFEHLADDLADFSPLLCCAVVFLFIMVLLYRSQDIRELPSLGFKSWVKWVLRFSALPVGLFAASFAVAIGGQYYNHHHVFALPAYMALVLLLLRGAVNEPDLMNHNRAFTKANPEIRYGPAQCRKALSVLCVILLFGFYLLPDFTYDENLSRETAQMKTHAEYADKLLDEKGINRYLYLGFNGPHFFGLTEHSPLGPVFAQFPDDYKDDKNNWFCQNVLAQLDQAQIVFVACIDVGVISERVWDILGSDFVRDNAHSVSMDGNPVEGLPDGFTYVTYLRKTS